ncbi:serine/threonine protein kinase [Streptomyces sp. BE147]|uniref:serine/threonine protein kinase n=1 Tax=unclassified Streptomyces TaxID=2593676 RepID=UPI002E7826BF|nr:serine/threonine protein kinase [Streptomyces sp. BE147]MEE1742013.1 serine/threonine protein kinase [Streptomyces sp. BE147]
MEHLRQDDPARIGPYVPLAALDARDGGRPVPDRRYLARAADGERTVLVCVPRADADPARWAEEAQQALRLSVPGFLPVTEAAYDPAGFPWYAAPYTPVLPLPAALAAHGGPLPERFVRALGAALANALAAAHAQGVTHAGVSPSAVLLTADGPWLAGFGAVRAAGPDGTARVGPEPGGLAPEQLTGGRPRPLGDVYGLGAVLSYASTGHVVPESAELPASLRPLITACLARDPAARPDAARLAAGPGAGAAGFPGPGAGTGDGPGTGAPGATVLDAAFPVPLPARVVAGLVRQSAAALAAELPLSTTVPTARG